MKAIFPLYVSLIAPWNILTMLVFVRVSGNRLWESPFPGGVEREKNLLNIFKDGFVAQIRNGGASPVFNCVVWHH